MLRDLLGLPLEFVAPSKKKRVHATVNLEVLSNSRLCDTLGPQTFRVFYRSEATLAEPSNQEIHALRPRRPGTSAARVCTQDGVDNAVPSVHEHGRELGRPLPAA